jgi:type I restriction enzyme S subunit
MTEVRPLRAYAEIVLGRQRAPQHDEGPHMVSYLRAANVKDGSLDLNDVKEMNFSPAEQKVFSLRPGDVLVTEGSGSLATVGASTVWSGEIQGRVCFQNTLLRLRPRPGTDPRFLAWWCRYAFTAGVFASVATGANIFHLSAERVRDLPVTYQSLKSQRAIADFLDAETARIDTLISKKSNLLLAAKARFRAWAERLLTEQSDAIVPLMYLTDPYRPIVYGIVQAGPEVIDGVPYIKTGDLSHLTVDRLSKTTPEIDAQYSRARVHPGDIVVAMRASIGQAVVVPDDLPCANLTQGTARVAAAVTVNKTWLLHAFRTNFVQQQCRMRAVGTTFRTLNIWDLRRVLVPYVPLSVQNQFANEITAWGHELDELSARLAAQIGLLRERRAALITAAVTGQLEIPGVAR